MRKLLLGAVLALLGLVTVWAPAAGAHAGEAHPAVGRVLSEGANLFGLQQLLQAPAATALAQPDSRGRSTVSLQFLNVSDWHGQLDPLVVGTTQIGGAAAISAYWSADRAANPNTLAFTAGDAFGATPPLSAFFNDEPAVKALNLMGIQVDTLGNHNFDTSLDYLQNLIDLSDYDYVSANLENVDDALTGVAPWKVYKIDNFKVGVVGVTNPEAPTLVFPGRFGPIVPTDPAAAAMAAKAAAEEAGAKAVILITHMGVTHLDPATQAPAGPLVDLANSVSGFDAIFGDHTDFQFSGVINGQLVVENRSKGLTYARTAMTFTRGGDLVSQDVDIVSPVATAVTPDPAVVAMLAPYRTQVTAVLGTPVGSSTVEILRSDSCGRADGRLCESLVGNVTTDAIRANTLTDFAITNSGGLRDRLTCPAAGNTVCAATTPPPHVVTKGQVLAVLPFGNVVVTVSLSGSELKTALENGVSSMPGANGRFAQVSGLCFTYDIAAPVGSRVVSAVRQATGGSCSGAAVDLTAGSSYAVAMNDFMASGGDGYADIRARIVTRGIMAQVLEDHIAATSPLAPTLQGRIVCTDSNGVTAPNCPVPLP